MCFGRPERYAALPSGLSEVMPSTLDYAGRSLNVRSLAVPAFICGLLSGPAAIGFALLAAHNDRDEQLKERLALSAMVVILGGAFVFSCVARSRLPVGASSRMRVFANLAIAAPILWAAGIIAFLMILFSQVGT
jgi:hypothetical protein